MQSALTSLLTRRSVSVRDLHAPAPNDAELEQILRVATRVADHGKLCPWRIVILRENGAKKLGEIAAQQFAAKHSDATDAELSAERTRFARAPLCVSVLVTPVSGGKPVWEQELSAGAVCMNMLQAVHALGYGAKWLSEWVAYDAEITAALMQAARPAPRADPNLIRVAGFIYIGSKVSEPEDRPRPELEDVVSEF